MNSLPDMYITQILPTLAGIKLVNGEWLDIMTRRPVTNAHYERALKDAIFERYPEDDRAAFAAKIARYRKESN